MKTKLILICDTKNEIDDQFAITYALLSPEIELLGVISTQNNRRNGENSCDIYHEEACKLMELADSKVPTFRGATRAFNPNNPEKSNGTDFILQSIQSQIPDSKFQIPITVACTGPATDIANLIALDTTIKDKISFIWLGGYKHKFMQRFHHNEVNFAGDPEAAKLILSSNIDLLRIPTLGTSHTLIIHSGKMQKKLRAKSQPLHDYLAELIDWNKARIKKDRPTLSPFLNYWVLFDIAAVAMSKNLGIKKIGGKPKTIYSIDYKKILRDFEATVLK